ncbi:MAG: acyl-CoA/acyl-ACP dehydrogenase [Deltaproteobacteria bacterium]|nr:acyl-CoA/acyl-ACP dehydrogenase [Deltaproteobacteria bacterium]MBW2418072.1 acyl-CoA/acyl-ACP dehydrogenase [Deltaproteobacteria bacterium]
MDVQFSEEQVLLRESARDFLEKECPPARVRELMDEPRGSSDDFWKKLADLGWLGLTLPEEHGGAGLDLLDLAIVLEEMGRALVPDPFLSTLALGARAIELAGSAEQQARYLPAVAQGRLRIALAFLEEEPSWSPEALRLADGAGADGFRLEGDKSFVSDAASADLLLVPVRSEAGVSCLLVETSAAGVEIAPVAYNDMTRKVSRVCFSGTALPADALLGEPGRAWPWLQRVLDFAKVALCAEMLGGAQRAMEMSVAYAKQREQFGRPIGSFQAIQHKCANQLVKVEGMRSATWYAAWSVAGGEPDAHTSACLAKAYCSEAYSAVAGDAIQIHGGLGFTWEQDPHLFYKRAKADELLFGSPSANRELAAREIIDGRGAG